jgi:hypothetical protein
MHPPLMLSCCPDCASYAYSAFAVLFPDPFTLRLLMLPLKLGAWLTLLVRRFDPLPARSNESEGAHQVQNHVQLIVTSEPSEAQRRPALTSGWTRGRQYRSATCCSISLERWVAAVGRTLGEEKHNQDFSMCRDYDTSIHLPSARSQCAHWFRNPVCTVARERN